MILGLRGRILLLTALPLAALTAASLWLVDRGVSSRTQGALREDLQHAADLLETLLAARTTQLEVTGAVIVRDPRFFSMLTLPHAPHDPQFRATVAGVAGDFEALAHPDVFEVVDARGEVVASVGSIALDSAARSALAPDALAGRTAHHARVVSGRHVLTVTTPVVADRRVVGALLLGTEVGGALASNLRELTKSDVTFLSGGRVTRTTLGNGPEREVARTAASRPGAARELGEPGNRWLALARPIPFGDSGEGDAFVVQRSFDAETAFLRDVRGHLVELGLLAILVVTLAAAFIAIGITRPVRQLVDAADGMEHGRWDAPLDTSRRDEMGTLASRFDHMRRRQRVYVEQLEEVARAKSEFIAVASHELRTPIAIILGWRDLFSMGAVMPAHPRWNQGLEAIGSACKTLERIAVDATRMADARRVADDVTRAWAPVQPVLEAAVREALSDAQERDVVVHFEVEPGAGRARMDAAKLQQAVGALVRNGIRFTPDGGAVEVTAIPEGAGLNVVVRDNGVGLSPAMRTRLAERTIAPRDSGHHHTGHGLEFNRPGLGFGLALARQVAEAHGGELRIDGEEGRGSTFTLVLPGALDAGDLQEAA